MKNIIVLGLIILACNGSQKEPFQSVLLSASFPLLTYEENEVRLHFLTDSIRINYEGDYLLYELPQHDLSFYNGNFINEKIKFNLFLFKNGDTRGYFLANDTSSNISILLVDSILSKRISWSKNIDSYDTDTTLTQLPQEQTDNEIVKKFIPKTVYDETIFDTLFLYFKTSFQDIKFSFSRKMDSLTGMKLYKIRYLYNEKYLPKLKANFKERELLIEMTPETADQKEKQKRKFEDLLKKLQFSFPDIRFSAKNRINLRKSTKESVNGVPSYQ